MTTWEEYYAINCNTRIYPVYFENNRQFMKMDTNNNLKMVNSKNNATKFILEDYCDSDAMRQTYNIILGINDNTQYCFDGDFNFKDQIKLRPSKKHESSNFYIKGYYDDKYELEKVAFLFFDEKDKSSTDKYYAFDNYGDGRVVWYNTGPVTENEYYSKIIEIKDNQYFNVIKA